MSSCTQDPISGLFVSVTCKPPHSSTFCYSKKIIFFPSAFKLVQIFHSINKLDTECKCIYIICFHLSSSTKRALAEITGGLVTKARGHSSVFSSLNTQKCWTLSALLEDLSFLDSLDPTLSWLFSHPSAAHSQTIFRFLFLSLPLKCSSGLCCRPPLPIRLSP